MDDTQRQTLLRLARDTVEAEVRHRPLPDLPSSAADLPEFGGVFVTLKVSGRLRGCIGRFKPDRGLAESVQRMALSALEDPRFVDCPLREDELPRLRIEISVLSNMQPTDDPLSLVPGKHGIYIRKGYRTGCFLPQVATEQGWNVEELLSRCCSSKAGIPADAWSDRDTEVSLFTAEVFGDPP